MPLIGMQRFRVWDSALVVSWFEFQVSGFGFRACIATWFGFRVWVSGPGLTCIATRRHAMLPSILVPPRPAVSGFAISGFEFWVSSLGFRVSGMKFRISGLGLLVSHFGFRASVFEFGVSNFGFRASDIEFGVWGFEIGVQGLMSLRLSARWRGM